MKVCFASEELRELFEVDPARLTGKQKFSASIVKQYQAKVSILMAIPDLAVLRTFKSLNFEALKKDRRGEYSIRLNKQYRLIFKLDQNGELEILIIEISKHYE